MGPRFQAIRRAAASDWQTEVRPYRGCLVPPKASKSAGGSTPDRAGTLEPAQTAMINGFVWCCIYVSYEPFFCFVLFYIGGFVECVTAGCAHMRVAHVHLAPQEIPHASLPTVELAQILGVPIGSYWIEALASNCANSSTLEALWTSTSKPHKQRVGS